MTLFSNITPKRVIWVSNSGNNGNNGSEHSPMKSIQAALDKAAPGTAVMVKAGTYVENVVFKESGRADAPIQLISADGIGAAKIKPGRIMFEIDGVGEDVAEEALRLAAMKLPIKCRFVAREDW